MLLHLLTVFITTKLICLHLPLEYMRASSFNKICTTKYHQLIIFGNYFVFMQVFKFVRSFLSSVFIYHISHMNKFNKQILNILLSLK